MVATKHNESPIFSWDGSAYVSIGAFTHEEKMTLYGHTLYYRKQTNHRGHYYWDKASDVYFNTEHEVFEWLNAYVDLSEKEKYSYSYKDKLEGLLK